MAESYKQQRVTAELPSTMYVVVVTEKAIGLAEDLHSEVELWLPLSQLDSEFEIGEMVDEIELPRWLAEEHDLATSD